MVDPKELRLNNLILFKSEIMRVDSIFAEQLFLINSTKTISSCFTAEEVDAIPLTPYILEACGFENPEGSEFWYNGKVSIIMPGKGGYENGRLYFNSWYIIEPPKYLHTLMNFFYYLTGTELSVNLDKEKV